MCLILIFHGLTQARTQAIRNSVVPRVSQGTSLRRKLGGGGVPTLSPGTLVPLDTLDSPRLQLHQTTQGVPGKLHAPGYPQVHQTPPGYSYTRCPQGVPQVTGTLDSPGCHLVHQMPQSYSYTRHLQGAPRYTRRPQVTSTLELTRYPKGTPRYTRHPRFTSTLDASRVPCTPLDKFKAVPKTLYPVNTDSYAAC